MTPNLFRNVASFPENSHYIKHIHREFQLYQRENEIRSPYDRDYDRILHSLAYRRLKHKTQVFFNIDNDHICTRMEHVQHVESVSTTISRYLGLNTELTRAIAVGHDLGHTPFGHEGEIELTNIRKEYKLDKFWHERNSLRMIDDIELLQDNEGNYQNLNLTYAVRDGIISHCGEVDEIGIKPRRKCIDLQKFRKAGQFQPYTWEGCVVKLSDKIGYLGRDIEDALRLHFLEPNEIDELYQISNRYGFSEINVTVLLHAFIISVCEHSTPETSIHMSEEKTQLLNEIKHFNYKHIYTNPQHEVYRKYVSLILHSIFERLMSCYDGDKTPENLQKLRRTSPLMANDMLEHLCHYSELEISGFQEESKRCHNRKIYAHLETEVLYVQAILDYISGMTDKYAIKIFDEMITYERTEFFCC
ncbi:MAG: HD domain-containing protein [Oscillospiraceae bacterium]